MTRGKRSLAKFVAATLVTVTTLLLVALGVAAYRSEARVQRDRLDMLTSVQAKELAVALAVPLWNIDRPTIAQLLDAMTQPQSVYGVSVTAGGETYGRVRNARWELVPWSGRGAPAGLIVQARPVVYGGTQIGSVRLYVSQRFMQQDLRDLMRQLAFAIVAVDLLIIVSVYLVLWRSVLRPLTEIERYAGAVSSGVQRRIAAPSAGSAAELESLRQSIESMVNLLQQREERFRSIFESANDAIFILDHDSGAILDVNARLYDIFGYTHEEVDALDMGVLSAGVPPYEFGDAVAAVRNLRPGDRQIMEWRARHKDGHLFQVEISLRAATIGNALCVVSVVRDIEERKAMEEKLRRSETMSMMGDLVAGVAHEVRNPLFGIAATLDAFEAELGGETVQEYLATLRNDVSRLGRLMHDLLDYGRPQQSERRAQSLRPVIAEAVRVCSPRAKQKGIEIREEIPAALPPVSINADRMLQVLKNVVENAVEFSAAGEAVTLRVGVIPSAARNPQIAGDPSLSAGLGMTPDNGAAALVCTVADRGPGFRQEDLPHVFEPFFTRRAGGSGLGLAIVQKIVGEHGGTIAAHNAVGGGGVVEIRLPVTSTTRRTGSPPSP